VSAAWPFVASAGSGGRSWLRAHRPAAAAALALSLAVNAVPLWLASTAGPGGSPNPLPLVRGEVLSTRTIALASAAPAAEPVVRPVALPVAATIAAAPAARPAVETPPLELVPLRSDPPGGAAQAAPAAQAPAEPLLRAGELDRSPRPLGEISPHYPEAAGSRGGSVVLRLFIDEQGVVERAEVVRAEPGGLFEEAARAAFMAARFEPGLRAGRPVRSEMTVEVEFTADRDRSGSPRY